MTFESNPDFAIADEKSLRGLFDATHSLAVLKCQDILGEHAKEFIRRSPFLCIGTQNLEGKADVSPRGDPAGFVKVLDERTLAIPDRPGNQSSRYPHQHHRQPKCGTVVHYSRIR